MLFIEIVELKKTHVLHFIWEWDQVSGNIER